MENLIPFLGWVWSLAWKAGLAVFLFLILVAGIKDWFGSRLYHKHIGHPIDLLTVLSTERWDTIHKWFQLLNAKHRAPIFHVGIDNSSKKAPWYERGSVAPTEAYMDIAWLEEKGFVECRLSYFDKCGNRTEYKLVDFAYFDEQGEVIGYDQAKMVSYTLKTEYRKTSKGGPPRNNSSKGEFGEIPEDGLGAL